jgi:hypothetical protein
LRERGVGDSETRILIEEFFMRAMPTAALE